MGRWGMWIAVYTASVYMAVSGKGVGWRKMLRSNANLQVSLSGRAAGEMAAAAGSALAVPAT